MVKDSLCAQDEPQCGLCEQEGPAVNMSGSKNYSDSHCFCRHWVAVSDFSYEEAGVPIEAFAA